MEQRVNKMVEFMISSNYATDRFEIDMKRKYGEPRTISELTSLNLGLMEDEERLMCLLYLMACVDVDFTNKKISNYLSKYSLEFLILQKANKLMENHYNSK